MRKSEIEQIELSNFYTKLIVIILILIATLVIFGGKNQEKEYKLSKEQQLRLIDTIGMKSFKNMYENGCINPVAEYINTSKWTDHWCASSYSHIDFIGIK